MRTTTVTTGSIDLFARVAGQSRDPALVLLHGWPHDGSLYDPVIDLLGEDYLTVAFDLPAVGRSTGAPPSGAKADLAAIVLDAAEALGARRPVIAGIDCGGMIAFSAARHYPGRISAAAIGNVAIPGIDPWDKVVANPHLFHFALHSVPDLPELLVTGRERSYFDFFFDFLGSRERRLPEHFRRAFTQAYVRPEALGAGFDWYRAFPDDARANREGGPIDLPLLYFRGEEMGRDPEPYAAGLRSAGATDVETRIIAGAAEFAPIEQPQAFAAMIGEFAARSVSRASAHE